MQRIRILLPAYNEALSLPPLLERIAGVREQFGLDLEVLVFNDGSSDDTLEVVKKFMETAHWTAVYDQQPNQGLAAVMRNGLKEAIKDLKDEDILVTMDGDNSHPPGLIFRMLTQLREGSDLVIASRHRSGSRILGLAWHRKMMSLVAGYLFRIFRPIKGVRDYTCGYRAYKVSLLREACRFYGDGFIRQQGFACMAEILLRLKRFRPVIHELPFILRYDLKKGESKMKVGRTVRQTLLLILNKT